MLERHPSAIIHNRLPDLHQTIFSAKKALLAFCCFFLPFLFGSLLDVCNGRKWDPCCRFFLTPRSKIRRSKSFRRWKKNLNLWCFFFCLNICTGGRESVGCSFTSKAFSIVFLTFGWLGCGFSPQPSQSFWQYFFHTRQTSQKNFFMKTLHFFFFQVSNAGFMQRFLS